MDEKIVLYLAEKTAVAYKKYYAYSGEDKDVEHSFWEEFYYAEKMLNDYLKECLRGKIKND